MTVFTFKLLNQVEVLMELYSMLMAFYSIISLSAIKPLNGLKKFIRSCPLDFFFIITYKGQKRALGMLCRYGRRSGWL